MPPTPFFFVASYQLKEGQLENYAEWTKGLIDYVEAKEPRMVAFNVFVNDAGTEVAAIQVHPDARSMELHMQVVREYIDKAYGDFLESPTMVLVCGEGDAARHMIREVTPPEFPLNNLPRHVGGFTRSAAQ